MKKALGDFISIDVKWHFFDRMTFSPITGVRADCGRIPWSESFSVTNGIFAS
jgi:hypothetical protein